MSISLTTLILHFLHGPEMSDTPESTENKSERIQMLMSPSEVKAIDDWGFENRIRTRAEAIRRLCQVGLTYQSESLDIQNKATALWDSLKAVPIETDELDYPTDEHFDAFAGIIDTAADLVTNIRHLDAARRFLSDGEKDNRPDGGEKLRRFLAETRAKRAAKAAASKQDDK